MNDFKSKLEALSQKILSMKATIQTEEATKTNFIMPFFSILGYDVFDVNEFHPEYIADVGTKKGEKIDYAIMQHEKPIMIIEAKSCMEALDKHVNQLNRYFGVLNVKFAILTNGIEYRFYTDFEMKNRMDTTPFFSFSFESFDDAILQELNKFRKEQFNVEHITNTAEELKYLNMITDILKQEVSNPSDEMVKMLIAKIYDGSRTQSVVERFKPLITQAFNNTIHELLNEKLQVVLNESKKEIISEPPNTPSTPQRKSVIVTTEKELEAFDMIKDILKEYDASKISYKDTVHYLSILINQKTWLARLYISNKTMYIEFPSKDGKSTSGKIQLFELSDLYKYSNKIINTFKRITDLS